MFRNLQILIRHFYKLYPIILLLIFVFSHLHAEPQKNGFNKSISIFHVPKDHLFELERADSVIEVYGIVYDEKGNPIPGVTIVARGSKKGGITNVKGEFAITGLFKGEMVIITNLGYVSQEFRVEVNMKRKIIFLKESINSLDETVVAGYSTTSRRFNVGGITTLTSKSIENKPISNPLLAIQAEVPGVVINQTTGNANSGITVLIRGQNSFNNGTDPLYVVDGVPYPSQLLPLVNNSMGNSGMTNNPTARPGNPLSFLNPNDIESISVLRDADATSIYGSRAAAGAIIITTKKGKIGRMKLNIDIQHGLGKVGRRLELLKTKEYLKMRHEAKANDGVGVFATDYDINGTWDSTKNTDWQKVLLGGNARFTNFQGSASGGSEMLQYLLGVGYRRETTVFPTELGDQKGSVHLNINNFSINKKFQLQLSASYMFDKNDCPIGNLTSLALGLPPNAPNLYNQDGSLNWALNSDSVSTWVNPLSSSLAKGKILTTNLISNLRLQYEILPSLNFKTNVGYTTMGINETRLIPLTVNAPENRKYSSRGANYSYGNSSTWIIEPQLSYNRNFDIGKLEVLMGATLQEKVDNQSSFEAGGFSSDLLLKDPVSATILVGSSTINTMYKYNALFGIVNYRLKDKYIVNITARRDGSSRFGSENLFSNFWSLAGGWIFSSEQWVEKNIPFLSFGKIRASYGTSGNDQIGDYKFINNYNSNVVPRPYQGIVGLTPEGIPNPYLQWEETKKMQFGIDLGFFKDVILLNMNYYRNRSSNQLLSYQLSNIAGESSYPRNLPATIQNSGIEITVSSMNIKNTQFTWNTNFNLTMARNKLISFPGLAESSYAFDYIIGQPMSGFRLFNYKGVNKESGRYEFLNSKGELTTSPNYLDKSKMVDLTPTFYGGINNELNYRNLQIGILIQATECTLQNSAIGFRPGPGTFNQVGNQPEFVTNRWQEPGNVSDIQRYSSLRSTSFNSALNSTLVYMKARTLRLKNVSLSWKLPLELVNKLHLSSCRVFANCSNLLTITNYKGLDPESGTSALPPLRIIMGGINVGF